MFHYFGSSLIFTVFCLFLAGLFGEYVGGIQMALTYMTSCAILGVLETSVSLDNAVVNATILKEMSDVWKHRFLTWGIMVAVLGMRLVFPLFIVSIAGHLNPIEAVNVALLNPEKYKLIITSVHMQIMAFGGAFLMMIFAAHFIDKEKESHWIPVVGPSMSAIGKHGTSAVAIPMAIVLILSMYVQNQTMFLFASFTGVLTYMIVEGLGDFFEIEDGANAVAKTGIAAFIYLETLDASFSFDGVIAAFAITNNFVLIMLGLGIGSMFVRSLTLMLVDKGALDELEYLEDGAFYGIGWLIVTMFMSIQGIELSDFIVAGGAALFIATAAIHSYIKNKKE